ncbi:hypothetical protein AABB24_009941, partial [Solanum stoloniferum]
ILSLLHNPIIQTELSARLYTPMEEDKSTNTIEPQKGAQQNPIHWPKQAWTHFELVRQKSPLVQCITNFVSMDLMANTLLSAGASPAMIHSVEEIPEFTPKALGVCINAGTLAPDWLPGMKLAAQVANQSKKPWVLDPVAAGGSSFRLKACLELLALKPSVVRGNGSEILALFKGCVDSNSKGADSVHGSSDAVEAAKSLAQQSGSVVAISGAVDYITVRKQPLYLHEVVVRSAYTLPSPDPT